MGVLTETRCGAKPLLLTSVMSKWFASCILLRLEQEREPEIWEKLHVGGFNGIRCLHLQVMATKLTAKNLGMARRRSSRVEPRQRDKTTMSLASLDIKTAFDEARPRHVANIHGEP